ncbi:hypothetical protein ANO11243_074910 [Dothideomycetidae sp. 11243]|nr:hypothetical protein ANO11243_074910 [fungal sp. No.11243]
MASHEAIQSKRHDYTNSPVCTPKAKRSLAITGKETVAVKTPNHQRQSPHAFKKAVQEAKGSPAHFLGKLRSPRVVWRFSTEAGDSGTGSTGSSRQRMKSLRARPFSIPISATESLSLSITEPGLVADNLPLETWASASILAAQLQHIPISFPPPSTSLISIVELGAGTGVVGLTAAKVYGKEVVLTDLPPIVPGLWANINLNEVPGVRAGVLDWTKPEVLRYSDTLEGEERSARCEGVKAHVLLAADTLYSEEHPALLTGTVEAWLSRHEDARFVMGTALRVAYLEELRELWARLEGLGLECVAEGKGEASEADFDDERLVEWSVWRWKR